jgi:DNA-binding NarL/FixJ family response regulator
MTRVTIMAPYASMRAGLNALLVSAAGDLVVAGEASGLSELERMLEQARPDVVLLDETEPGDASRVLDVLAAFGVDGIGEARMSGDAPTMRPALVGLAAEPDAGDFARLAARHAANEAGNGWAYLSKEAEAGEIAGAVRAAAAGLVALEASLAPGARLGPEQRRGGKPRRGRTAPCPPRRSNHERRG